MTPLPNEALVCTQNNDRIRELEAEIKRLTRERDEANAAINDTPEPLRQLGEWLARKLDDDDWPTADRLLNGAVAALARKDALLREARSWIEYFEDMTASKDAREFIARIDAEIGEKS